MKANEFVMRFGWDDAMEYLCGASFSEVDGTPITPCANDLKRLVESHELIASRGGLDAAKHELIAIQKHLNNTFGWVTIITSEKIDRLKQAIEDVESCK